MKKIILTIPLALFGWSNIASAQDSQRKTIAVTQSAIEQHLPIASYHSGRNEQARMNKTNTGKELPIAETKIVFDWIDKSWIFFDTIIYTYDANNNLMTRLWQVWETKENFIKDTYTYDANNNTTSYLEQTWDKSSNTWESHHKKIYTYDASNNQTTYLEQNWDKSSNTWENTLKYIYTYDTNNNKTTSLFQLFQILNMYALIEEKSTYTYDANNNLTSQLKQYLDSSNTWLNKEMYTYTYDANNNMTSCLYQGWTSSNAWENNQKFTYTYDANNNQTTYLEQTWASFNHTWLNEEKSTYTYDANNKLTTRLQQIWEYGTHTWQLIIKETKDTLTYTYDTNNNLTSKLEQTWDTSSNTFVNNALTKYYYKIATGIKEEVGSSEQFGVYPNPSNGKFTIVVGSTDIKAISICNALGQVLYQQPFFPKSETLNLELGNSFPTGLYIIQITTDDKVYRQKLIKQ